MQHELIWWSNLVCHVLAKQGGNMLCWPAFFQTTHWFISRDIWIPQKKTGHSRDCFLITVLCLAQVTGKCENHRESLEQSLRWDEPRCVCQLYDDQKIICTSLLNRSLLYDSEDRSAWCRFGEGRRLCNYQRLSWCSEAHRAAAAPGLCSSPWAFLVPVNFGATWHPSSLRSAALEIQQPGGVLWRGANFPSI